MVFTSEDKILIKNLYQLKRYNCARLLAEFSEKNWTRGGLEKLLRKIRETGTCDRRKGSGRLKSARTDDNIAQVEDLVLSQEDKPQTHRTTRQISRETGLSQSSVVRIIHRDLKLKCFKKRRAQELTDANRTNRLIRSTQLLAKFTDNEVDFIWFTDEKVFTVTSPKNPQNDRVYAPVTAKKKNIAADRLLRTRTTFFKSVMVSVGVSKLGRTHLIFIDPGVKINGAYYRDVLLTQEMLPVMREISGDFFIFQQDSAPAHRARETVSFLQREVPALIAPDLWPSNSPDLNPVDYKVWGTMQDRVYQTKVRDVEDLKRRLIDVWNSLEQSVIDDSINQWRLRLRACVHANGGHFEHCL